MIVNVKGNLSSGVNSARGPSPNIWTESIMRDLRNEEKGIYFHDDFLGFAGTVASNVGKYAGEVGWVSSEDTGTSIVYSQPTGAIGAIRLSTAATDNNGVSIGTLGGGFVINTLGNSGCKMFLEGRFQLSQITSGNFFFGLVLAGIGDAVDELLLDAGGLADVSAIGFLQPESDLGNIDFVYNTASGGGVTTHKNNAAAIAASTWVKLGLTFDPYDGLRYYVNGLEVAGVDRVLASATNFPDGLQLCPIAGVKANGANQLQLDIDWIRAGIFAS